MIVLRVRTLAVASALGSLIIALPCQDAPAFEILGTGTESLIGNDLTDLGDDGDPESDIGYDAIFDSSNEPGFGGGEFAFNVFDNLLGPGNDKWCCGVGGGIDEDNPIWVSAQLPVGHFLTNFTVSSANDVPDRDPIHWSLQGSNDGNNYTDIYTYDDDFGPWDDRLQVIEFSVEDGDFPAQTTSYEYFRFATFNTISNPNGAYFQVGELELFGEADGVTPPIFVAGEDTIGVESYEGDQSNWMFGPEEEGVSGWSSRIVTFDESGVQLDNHTIAQEVLEDNEGQPGLGAYPVVDLAGGGGTFSEDLPYPNGVNDTTQNDFVVEVTADVTIPAGIYTIGFGSDDGGRVQIEGVEFDLSQNNDDFEADEIRFEGNRGHQWTVGSFELAEELTTTIEASFHERGGGDSFEIAVIEDEVIEDANPDEWELLGDGTLGWSVTTTSAPLVSADLTAEVRASRPMQFDVNGDNGNADALSVENPDPSIYNTILDVSGDLTFEIKSTGAVTSGQAFTIIDADEVVGTPTITSVDPSQTWVFDAATGQVCLDSCPGELIGDYNNNGLLDTGDLDLHASVGIANQDLAYDANNDGVVDVDDRVVWTNDLKNTWMGDADLNGVFDSSDFVLVFGEGQYETGGAATWGQGDWNGDQLFDSSDFVAAFSNGGYEAGPRPGGPNPVAAAVPEPSSLLLAVVSLLGVVGVFRRRAR